MLQRLILFCLLVFALVLPPQSHAYSLLTHEQLIDLAWQPTIVPLLLSRYPNLTPAQLEHARAYAYGGCVIQDIGYYPFGDQLFSDLTHYVRSGDFVVNLFRNAGNPDELAFAVGALSHYIGDTIGHPNATNISVPVEFPKLRDKYGSVVNYAQGEHQHVQTEFAFDIAMISHHRLAPVHYLRKVGLQVPTRQVALAFYQTYGLQEGHGRTGRINVAGYRFAVRRFIPRIAFAVNVLHRQHEPTEKPSAELTQLDSAVSEIATENHWDEYRKKAGPGTYALAALIYILPKVGPIKLAAVKGPTAETEAEYVHSVLLSNAALNLALKRFTPPPRLRPAAEAKATENGATPGPAMEDRPAPRSGRAVDPRHPLPNRDLDTGNAIQPAGYPLTDQTYSRLTHLLTEQPQQSIPPGVKENILSYYADLTLPFGTKKHPGDWIRLQRELEILRMMPTTTEPDPFSTYEDAAADATKP